MSGLPMSNAERRKSVICGLFVVSFVEEGSWTRGVARSAGGQLGTVRF